MAHRLVVGNGVTGLVLLGMAAHATPFLSDGSDGAFAPAVNTTIDLSAPGTDGFFNFTTISVPWNVTVRFVVNPSNPPVVFGATGDVDIAGTVWVSAAGSIGGPGGGEGGLGGVGDNSLSTDGTGPSPGRAGGLGTTSRGGGGGGGGNATSGGVAMSRTGPSIGAAGSAVPPPPAIIGGSGGGGGGGGVFFGVDTAGGAGGGGGGGFQISTPTGSLNLSGSLISDGGHGHWGYVIMAGPGGGGSGGTLEINAANIVVGPDAMIRAIGGAGGGLSSESCTVTDPYRCSSYANGGLGYVVFDAGTMSIAAGAQIFARPVGATLPGFAPSNPILPIGPPGAGPWLFEPVDVLPTAFGGFRGPSLWFDPPVAVGYDYTVASARIASVELPAGFGDDVYGIWLRSPATGLFEFVQTLGAGMVLDLTGLNPFGTGVLSDGVDSLRVLGIEVAAMLDPGDTAAFPTGLTFLPLPGVGLGNTVTASVTMSPIVEEAAVPEPGTLAMLLIGVLVAFGRARSRSRCRVSAIP